MCFRQTYWTLPVAKFAATRWCGVVEAKLAQGKAALTAIDLQPAGTRRCWDETRTRRAVVSHGVLQGLQPLLWDLEALQSHVQLSKWLLEFNQLVSPVSAQLCDYMVALQAFIDAVDATVDYGTSDSNPLSTAPVAPEVFNDTPAPPAPPHVPPAPPHVPSAPPVPSSSAPAPANEEEEASVSPANYLADREELMTGSLKIIASSSTADDTTAASQPNGKVTSKLKGLLRRTISHQGSLRFAAAVDDPTGSPKDIRIFQADKILRTLSEKQGNFQLVDKTRADILRSLFCHNDNRC